MAGKFVGDREGDGTRRNVKRGPGIENEDGRAKSSSG